MGATSYKVRQTKEEIPNQVINPSGFRGSGNLLELYAKYCFYEHKCIAYIRFSKKMRHTHTQKYPIFKALTHKISSRMGLPFNFINV